MATYRTKDRMEAERFARSLVARGYTRASRCTTKNRHPVQNKMHRVMTIFVDTTAMSC